MGIRLILLLAGAICLLLAAGGLLCWALGFAFWSGLLLHGGTVFFDKGSAFPIPGRWLGTVVALVPFVGSVCGVWFLRAAFDGDDDHGGLI
jgi:hypothetical protein